MIIYNNNFERFRYYVLISLATSLNEYEYIKR